VGEATAAAAAQATSTSARNRRDETRRGRLPADGAGTRITALLAALLIDDGVAQHADARDVDLDDVAALEPERRLAARADAARRARHEHVAGVELRPDRAVRDEVRHREAELRDARILHRPAVQARPQVQRGRVRLLVARHEPRPEGRARLEVLARGPLRRMPLEVAHAAVVEAAPAGDVVERILAPDAARAFADDDGELAL